MISGPRGRHRRRPCTPLGDGPDDVFDGSSRRVRRRGMGRPPAEGFRSLSPAGSTTAASWCRPGRRGRALAVRAAAAASPPPDSPTRDRRPGLFVGSTMGESAAFEAAGDGARLDLDDAVGRRRSPTPSPAGSAPPGRAARTAPHAPPATMPSAPRAGAYPRRPRRRAVAGGVDAVLEIRDARVRPAHERCRPERCRPFDRNRAECSWARRAAFARLRAGVRRRGRGAPSSRCGRRTQLSGDAHHPTAPRADGTGMSRRHARRALTGAAPPPGRHRLAERPRHRHPQSDGAEAVAPHDGLRRRGLPPVSFAQGRLRPLHGRSEHGGRGGT